MKQKRIDIYLSIIGLCQLLLIGVGSEVLSEFNEQRVTSIFILKFTFLSIIIATMLLLYAEAHNMTNKRFKK
jgi:hypothetical protein